MALVAPTGTKTLTQTLAPHLTAAHLSTLLATPVESLTIANLADLQDATKRTKDGDTPGRTIGSLLT